MAQSSSEKKDHTQKWGENLVSLFHKTWEMEILLFGIVMVFLWQIPEYLDVWSQILTLRLKGGFLRIVVLLIGVFRIGVYIALFGMTFHLILRSFWVASIGLNSVFPEGLNYSTLKLNNRFQQYFHARIKNLPRLVETLDYVCSANFAITILLVLFWWSVMVSVILYGITLFWGIYPLIDLVALPDVAASILRWAIALILALLFLIYGFDFITNGKVKQIKAGWFAIPYFYWYRFLSILTLSFFYRPLYYTFLTHRASKFLPLLIVTLAVGSYVVSSTRYHAYMYFPESITHPSYTEAMTSNEVIKHPVISQKKITSSHLKLFIPYNTSYRIRVNDNPVKVHDDFIAKNCPEARPFHKHRIDFWEGIYITAREPAFDIPEDEEIPSPSKQEVLTCLENTYRIRLDDKLIEDLDLRFHRHKRHRIPGFTAYIPLEGKSPGWHKLSIKLSGDILTVTFDDIPFYYAPG